MMRRTARWWRALREVSQQPVVVSSVRHLQHWTQLARERPTTPVSPQQVRRRAGHVVTVVGLAWLAIAARLLQLQGWQHVEMSRLADRQREYQQQIMPRPGDIFDARGRLLATTVRTPSLYLVPSGISDRWETAQRIAAVLDLSADELYEKLGRYADKDFLWVKRRLSDSAALQIRNLALPKGTWGFRDEYQRVYPQGRLAAHVLGLRDIDGVGRGGIEESCNAQLQGVAGLRRLTRDARGRVIDVEADAEQPPQPGTDVALTIDIAVQAFAERELEQLMQEWKPAACCAIVMQPSSGDILAMASRPDFDPNRIADVPDNAWKNCAIADIYEPGSTFKPCIVSYGLDRGLISTTDSFFCEWGRYRMGRRLLHDHHPYGHLSLTDVLVKSSNIGMAKIGERMTNAELHAAAASFGFGRKTGIELPGELPGILRPLSEWTSYSTGSIPMGHELAATPLQLITAHAALANGGILRRPRIVQQQPQSGEDSWSHLEPAIIRPDIARWLVQEPMRQVVSRGTGKRAQLAGLEVFGKTGTAQVLSPTGGYLHGKYVSSFVCGAPADNPQLVVLVVINQATGSGGETFGGRIAAPVAANILRESLQHLRLTPSDLQAGRDGERTPR